MEHRDVKLGMKVVPFKKTARGYGLDLETSCEWLKAKNIKQPFLYVVSKNDVALTCVLSSVPDVSLGGDFFNSCDFVPYDSEELSKICTILNDTFHWVMKVDDVEVLFSGGSNAEYFKKHYESLGYSVNFDEFYYKKKNT